VIGIADEEWGEKVTAVVVLKEGQTLKASEVIEYCRDHLATYKKPKEVIFVPALPKTPTGKILKRELKMQYAPEQEFKGKRELLEVERIPYNLGHHALWMVLALYGTYRDFAVAAAYP